MSNSLKSYFLLDPDIHFLNHGSFGACPAPVFETYQAWQRRLEQQPVLFLGREYEKYDRQARLALASFLCANGDDLVYVPNVTHGVNIVARSLALGPGDEILASDHEYGACNYTWELVCRKNGATYIQQPLPFPVGSEEEMVEMLWQGVTPRTRVIYLSHITAPTALRLPIEAICQRARRAGILTVIDGAHAAGQIPLDMQAIGADFYLGNCHKWMLSPKGAGFLFARPEVQHCIEPLVVSWGYHATPQKTCGSQFLDYLTWSGTQDPAARLSVPAAIQFMQENNWEQVQSGCKSLLRTALERIAELVDQPPLYPLDSALYRQMAAASLPADTDIAVLKTRLYDELRVEVPMTEWNGRKFVRISVQGYNTQEDMDALVGGLKMLLPQVQQ
jgi:isopenicillin-N epimerase